MTGVFIIINEWVSLDGSTSSAILDNEWYASEQDAWMALNKVAAAHEFNLPGDEYSFALEDSVPGIQFDEYYIQELNGVKSA